MPRLATDGPLILKRPDGQTAESPTTFTVFSYRNTNGFSFPNFTYKSTPTNFQNLFGYDQTHIILNLFGLFRIDTGLDNPFAVLLEGAAAAMGDTGQCTGMSIASERLLLDPKLFTDFPNPDGSTASTVWNLAATAKLKRYIEDQQVNVWMPSTYMNFL